NVGRSEAVSANLAFTLPVEFTLVSGNLSRSFDTITAIDGVVEHEITINVSDNVNVSSVILYAQGTANNANSTNTTLNITITNPRIVSLTEVITNNVPGPSSGGGGPSNSGGGGSVSIVYSKTVEVVRGGNQFEFDVPVSAKTSDLSNVRLSITGYDPKYITITPKVIDNITRGTTESFRVIVQAPSYKSYEEIPLKVVIIADIISGNAKSVYSETQNIKLVVEEISHNDSSSSIDDAKNALEFMKSKGYNTLGIEQQILSAESKLADRKNKDAYDLANQAIATKEQAISTDNFIRKLVQVLADPSKVTILLLDSIKPDGIYLNMSRSDLTSVTGVFTNPDIKENINLALVAFERGDYALALQRAMSAQTLLLLERKGNALVFTYLYWPYMILAIVLIIVGGFVVRRYYQKDRLSRRIADLNKKEENLAKLIVQNQTRYFAGKLSSTEFHKIMNQHHAELVKLRTERTTLRNRRVKMLPNYEVTHELVRETKEIETKVKKLQTLFYNEAKISEPEYKAEFESLNTRLAEIEEERAALKLMQHHTRTKGIKMTHEEEKTFKEKLESFLGGKK
ncbi:MAG: hypothetical protein WCK90_03095, partial [archaeon]